MSAIKYRDHKLGRYLDGVPRPPDPVVLQARWGGRCQGCGRTIPPGQSVMWLGSGQILHWPTCPDTARPRKRRRRRRRT